MSRRVSLGHLPHRPLDPCLSRRVSQAPWETRRPTELSKTLRAFCFPDFSWRQKRYQKLCDKDFAERSGELSGAICLKTLVLLDNPIELFRKFFCAVRANFRLCGSFLAPDLREFPGTSPEVPRPLPRSFSLLWISF